MSIFDSRLVNKVSAERTDREYSRHDVIKKAALYSMLLAASTVSAISMMMSLAP